MEARQHDLESPQPPDTQSRCRSTRKTIPIRVLADEDRVIEARGDMTSKAGVPYRNHYSLHFRLEDGMIREMMEFMDSAYCERVLGMFPAERMRE